MKRLLSIIMLIVCVLAKADAQYYSVNYDKQTVAAMAAAYGTEAVAEAYYNEQVQNILKQGKAVVANVNIHDGNPIRAFVQIDGETNQVMAVPTPVIGRNLQVLSDELCLGGTELKSIQNGEALTFAVEDEPVTVGIDLKSDTGIRFANCDGELWRKEGKREWDKYTFGIYGCWVMDDDGNLDYVPEEEYTEELWNEQKKAAGRHASAVARK